MQVISKLSILCDKKAIFRFILAELTFNFFIDYKENLITERKQYYLTQPKDLQY